MIQGSPTAMQPQLDIELHSLAYKDRQLLKDLRQQVHPGEKILIVGATGSGKTSLLHTLNLTNPHFRGRILFQGKDLLDHKPEELRSRIMEVMQEPWLDDLSVESVLREPFSYAVHRRKFDQSGWRERVLRLLSSFALDGSYLQKRSSQLSGGEKQRIALIRAMQFEPEILLLDEISSALDQTTSRIISNCLFNNYRGTIIAISHDPLWQQSWQRIWSIEQGSLIEKGA